MNQLTSRFKENFSGTTRSRGQEYADSGCVEFISMQEDAVEAVVHGGDSYDVYVSWRDIGEGLLDMDCTCPHFADGFACKHIWATLVEVDQLMEPFAGRTRYAGLSSSRRSSRKRRGTGNRPAPAPPPWQSLLKRIEIASPGPPAFVPEPRPASRLWFVIDVSRSTALKSLVVDGMQQQMKQNGEWGVFKPIRDYDRQQYVPAELNSLVDELIAADEASAFNGYYYRGRGQSYGTFELNRNAQIRLLPELAQSGRLLWYLAAGQPLEPFRPLAWDDGPAWSLQLKLEPPVESAASGAAGEYLLRGTVDRPGESRPLGDVLLLLDDFVLFEDRIARAETAGSAWSDVLRQQRDVRLPAADLPAFLAQFHAIPRRPPLNLPAECGVAVERNRSPAPVLRMSQSNANHGRSYDLRATVHFNYDGRLIPADHSAVDIYDPDSKRIIVRDMAAERQVSAKLDELPLIPLSRTGAYRAREDRLLELTTKLGEQGWNVEFEGQRVRSAGNIELNVTSGIDWFDLDAAIDFDGVSLPFPELLKSLQGGNGFITLSDGSRGVLPEDIVRKLTALSDYAASNGAPNGLRFQRSQAAMLDALLGEQHPVIGDAQFRRWKTELKTLAGVPPKPRPKTFRGELRHYQEEGLGWLAFLQKFGFGGCLADDMGLGKTVQVLALLDDRRGQRRSASDPRRPSLVVVPKSLVFNWIEEAARFTPKLKVCNYTGLERRDLRERFDEFDVIVTTYGTLRQDIQHLKDVAFDYAILDESQAIKNSASLSAKACRLIQARHRLAMTGTPVENHLGELWSLFDFLNPGMLGRAQRFQSLTRSAARDPQELKTLSSAVAPFLLRRTKQQVLKELPEKSEQTIHCSLSPEERRYYNELRDHYRSLLSSKIRDQGGLRQAKIHVLEALLRLRQAACHPGLIDQSKSSSESAKLAALLQHVQEVIEEGHKALVFSQFTSLLSIVRSRLDADGIHYEYLDGKTRNRKAPVARFQNEESSRLFLISLKAGGHGLNLTAADYVFILDPWWNPAVEAQAVDRAHRIGQVRPVFAYRFIAKDTVEEKVLELQRNKKALADAIITANDSLIRTLTMDDLQFLLS